MPKNYVKLLLNLILIANQCVPRGGEIKVEMEGDPQSPSFTLQASGLNPRIPLGMKETLDGKSPSASMHIRSSRSTLCFWRVNRAWY